MADPSCPHKSERKTFFFKWWLCSDCRARIAKEAMRDGE